MLTCRWGDKGETGEIGDALSDVSSFVSKGWQEVLT